MSYTRMLKAAALSLACLGMLVPVPVLQAAAVESSPVPEVVGRSHVAVDVGLRSGGVLLGQVVNGQGIPLRRAPVELRQLDRKVGTTATDAAGYFSLRDLRGGTYQILAADAHGVFRLWAPNTAPPSARPGALLVAGDGPVRGQATSCAQWLCNPWIIAGLVAAAVAIPVAIHNSKNNDSTTSD